MLFSGLSWLFSICWAPFQFHLVHIYHLLLDRFVLHTLHMWCLLKMTVASCLILYDLDFKLRKPVANCSKRFSSSLRCIVVDALSRSQGTTRKHSTTLLSLPREDTTGTNFLADAQLLMTQDLCTKKFSVLKIGQQGEKTRQTTLLRMCRGIN